MDKLSFIALLISNIGVISGLFTAVFCRIAKITNGQKCQLRNEMLRTYYRHRETEVIHQYEYENFVMLYEAYKALKGNSFIDKIYKEIQDWEVIP